jgi:DNA-binding NarL/FixJ family response regulator
VTTDPPNQSAPIPVAPIQAAPIRVAVIDDQGVIRAGLRMIIDHEPDLTVVGEAADGLQAVSLVAETRPDVVLMDIRMPHLDGIEATRRITSAGSGAAVLVLTTFDDEEYVLGAVRAGAAGFLLKDAGPDVLVSAVRTLSGGDSLVDPAVTRTLIARCLELEARSPAGPLRTTGPTSDAGRTPTSDAHRIWEQRLDSLSDRERQIFNGMARGRSNRDLAADLVVSETTVKSHVSAVLAKLGLRSRVQAVVLAYEVGVITPGEVPLDDVPQSLL